MSEQEQLLKKQRLAQLISDEIENLYIESLTSISLSYGLYLKTKLKSIHFPNLRKISGDYNIYYMDSLTDLTLESLQQITGYYMIHSCRLLQELSLPALESCASSNINSNSALKSVDVPNLVSVGRTCFYGNVSLELINCPKLRSIGQGSFGSCPSLNSNCIPWDNLTDVVDIMTIFPKVVWRWKSLKTVGQLDSWDKASSFLNKSGKIFDFHTLTFIRGKWFYGSDTIQMKAMIIRTPTLCQFRYYKSEYLPPVDAKIYVPSILIDEYKNDNEWSVMANQFYPLEGSPFEDPDWSEEVLDTL